MKRISLIATIAAVLTAGYGVQAHAEAIQLVTDTANAGTGQAFNDYIDPESIKAIGNNRVSVIASAAYYQPQYDTATRVTYDTVTVDEVLDCRYHSFAAIRTVLMRNGTVLYDSGYAHPPLTKIIPGTVAEAELTFTCSRI